MTAAYAQRRITVTITLGAGRTFKETGGDTYTFTGYRVSAHITKAGGSSGGEAQVRIYGISNSLMNQLSTLGQVVSLQQRDTIIISAGDVISGMSVVFVGTTDQAWADYSGSPEVMFQTHAVATLYDNLAAALPSSYNGRVNAANIMQDLANKAGYGFENSGVSVFLSYPYLAGTVGQQIQTVSEQGNFSWSLEPNGGGQTLCIWPEGGYRNGQPTVVSAANGLVGYPSYISQGVAFKTRYNPQIAFGTQVTLQSAVVDKANATWVVRSLVHDLESEMPGGAWFTSIEANPLGAAIVSH